MQIMGRYDAELHAGLEAVRAASRVCRAVQARLVTAETLEKKDKSPVTVADFASQAIVCQRLEAVFADDAVVGEEGSAELREAGQQGLRDAVVREVAAEVAGAPDAAAVLDWIDRGGADANTSRYWTLDPIDGTKGFLRGEQYAVALGLIEDGEVVLGVLGCPNLDEGRGALFGAVRGEGARSFALADGADEAGTPIGVAAVASPAEARFCESVESAHSDQSESAQIAAELGITLEPYRIDSQCKYGAVGRGDASIYLRMPTRADYREKIWDHAAGKIVVEEAGGRVTDVFGHALDFSKGRTLEDNRGVVATSGAIHDEVIAAVRKIRGE
jgi:3'(2'), 5'-bisphosphate nucleotidase